MERELELFTLDVDSSMSKRIEKYITADFDTGKGWTHWSTYRHVEIMDKHLNSFSK